MAAVMSGAKKQFSFLSTDETSGITFSLKIEFYSQVKLLAHIFSSLLHKFWLKILQQQMTYASRQQQMTHDTPCSPLPTPRKGYLLFPIS